jgi:transposase
MEVPSRFEIDDELWAEIEPLIPVRQRRRRYPGRKAIPDRLVLNGILHVLHTGIAWEDLPQEYGYGSGVTAWRRLRDWQAAGVWDALHQRLLNKLPARSIGRVRRSMAPISARFWGAPDGAIPGRSFPHWVQAPPAGRCDRDPAGCRTDRRQPQ